MNTKTLYAIFRIVKTNKLSNMLDGLTYYRIWKHKTIQFEKKYGKFISKNYDELIQAFNKGYDEFDKAVKNILKTT